MLDWQTAMLDPLYDEFGVDVVVGGSDSYALRAIRSTIENGDSIRGFEVPGIVQSINVRASELAALGVTAEELIGQPVTFENSGSRVIAAWRALSTPGEDAEAEIAFILEQP